MKSDESEIRTRAVENICSKWRFGIVDKDVIGGSSEIVSSLLYFLSHSETKKNPTESTNQTLQLLLELSSREESVRILIREGGVQIVEDFKLYAKATQQPAISGIISNLINVKASTGTTIYNEELTASSAAATAAAEREATRRSEELKLRLKDRVRHRRPATSDSFFSEFRAQIGHTNPELCLYGCKTVRSHMLYETSISTWITEGSVLVELCDQLPILSRRMQPSAIPVSSIDIEIIDTSLSIMSIVINSDAIGSHKCSSSDDPFPSISSSLGILLYLSLSNSVVFLEGYVRVHALELLIKSSQFLSISNLKQLKDTSQYLNTFISNIETAVIDILNSNSDEVTTDICCPAAIISILAMVSLLEALQSHGMNHLGDVFPGYNDVISRLFDTYFSTDSENGILLAQRHPSIVSRMTVLMSSDMFLSTENVESYLKTDSLVILGAIASSTCITHCLDAISSLTVMLVVRSEAVKYSFTPKTISGVCRFLSVPPAGPSDCKIVLFVCRLLQRLLSHNNFLSEDTLEVIAAVTENSLLQNFFNTREVDQNTAYSQRSSAASGFARTNMEPAAAILQLVSQLIRRLHSDGYSQRALSLIVGSRLLYFLEIAFYSTSDLAGEKNVVRRQLMLSLVSNSCVVVKSCLAVLMGSNYSSEMTLHVGCESRYGSSPEAMSDVQNIIVSCYRIIENFNDVLQSETPSHLMPLTTLTQCCEVIVLGSAYLNLFSDVSTSANQLLNSSLWCLRKHWPASYYNKLSIVSNNGLKRETVRMEELFSTISTIVIKHPTAITDAIALLLEGHFISETSLFLSEVIKHLFSNNSYSDNNHKDLLPEVEATKSVIEESLFDQVFNLLSVIASTTSINTASVILLIRTIISNTNNATIASPLRPDCNSLLSTWNSVMFKAIAILKENFDINSLKWIRELGVLLQVISGTGDLSDNLISILCETDVPVLEFLLCGVAMQRSRDSTVGLSSQMLSEMKSLQRSISASCLLVLNNICEDEIFYKKTIAKSTFEYQSKLLRNCSDIISSESEPLRSRIAPCMLVSSLLRIDSQLWSTIVCKQEETFDINNKQNTLSQALVSLQFLCESSDGLFSYEIGMVQDALGAILAHSYQAKQLVLTSPKLMNNWLVVLEQSHLPNSSIESQSVLAILGLMQNLLHELQDLQEAEWMTRLGRLLRKSLEVLLVYPHSGLSNTQTIMLSGSTQGKILLSQLNSVLSLCKSFLLCGCSPEQQQLFKDVVHIISATGTPASPTKISKPLLAHSPAACFSLITLGCVSASQVSPYSRQRDQICEQLLCCLSCCGGQPKLIETVPAKKRCELIDYLSDVLWDLFKKKNSENNILSPLMKTLADISRVKVVSELVLRKDVIWDVLLGTSQCERLFSTDSATTLMIIRNIASSKTSHKSMLCIDQRIPLFLIEILLSTDSSFYCLKSKWISSSIVWNLIYGNEKNKQLLKQHIQPNQRQITQIIERHESNIAGKQSELILLLEVKKNLEAVETLLRY